MDIEIIKEEKNWLELEMDIDISVLNWLVEKLNQDKNVEFAAYKRDHPTVGKPTLVLRTKGKDAAKVLGETIEESEKEVDEFAKAFDEIVKAK